MYAKTSDASGLGVFGIFILGIYVTADAVSTGDAASIKVIGGGPGRSQTLDVTRFIVGVSVLPAAMDDPLAFEDAC